MPIVLDEASQNPGALAPSSAIDAAAHLGSQSQQEVGLTGTAARARGSQRIRTRGIPAIECECSGFAIVAGIEGIDAFAPGLETKMEYVLAARDRHRILELNHRVGEELVDIRVTDTRGIAAREAHGGKDARGNSRETYSGVQVARPVPSRAVIDKHVIHAGSGVVDNRRRHRMHPIHNAGVDRIVIEGVIVDRQVIGGGIGDHALGKTSKNTVLVGRAPVDAGIALVAVNISVISDEKVVDEARAGRQWVNAGVANDFLRHGVEEVRGNDVPRERLALAAGYRKRIVKLDRGRALQHFRKVPAAFRRR